MRCFTSAGGLLAGLAVLVSISAGAATGPNRPGHSLVIPGNGISGIEGVALVGQILPSPTAIISERVPLPDALITVRHLTGGPTIASQRTDENGQFLMPLSAGRYELVPLPPSLGSFPRGIPQRVLVRPGSLTHVVVEYDSGLR